MALVAENLTLRRGERIILSGLSFRADAGEALLLTGPNGAGKSTLLRALAGLLPPANGRVGLIEEGAEVRDVLAEHCHFFGHLNAVKSSLTVIENAEFWARYLGGPSSGVTLALERFHLSDLGAIAAGYLSAGQRRRLGLSRLLLALRPVWLLDEPAVSLDTVSQGLLAGVVNEHLARGGIVVAATHQPLGFAPSRELQLGGDRGEFPAPVAELPTQ